ncbi:MAG: MarR family winged helix-turn-helix transcriptional regulator [Bdellovibrionota bacterium]
MKLDRAIRLIQIDYPRIYLACHTRHQRKRSTEFHLSARDSSILAHLDTDEPMAFAALAKHLGLARSTLSEALKKLERAGYVLKHPSADKRVIRLSLTEKGADAISATSVLEFSRLEKVLKSIPNRDLQKIVAGFELFAEACQKHG